MPKSNRRVSRTGAPDVILMKFHFFRNDTLVSGAQAIDLNPAIVASAAALSAVFQLYRFKSFRYRLQPNTSITDVEAIGYYPDPVGGSTNAETLQMQGLDSIMITKYNTAPTSWHSVPPSRLKGLQDWYKCVADAGDLEAEIQGRVSLTGDSTQSVWWEGEGVIEFKNPVANGLQ
jgi:hypothetical protein